MAVLELYLATLTIINAVTANVDKISGELCYRPCQEGDNRLCYFDFEVHLYQTLSRACHDCPINVTDCSSPQCVPGDGVKRLITVVNKQMPGPAIQVCKGDTIIVKLKNNLINSAVTIHWHGITMEGSPHMDGVPGVTQCPVISGGIFTYKFKVFQSGTHFWHAHTGFHRGDGLFGPLVVRLPPNSEPMAKHYDYDLPEHTVTVFDWLHITTEEKFTLRHYGGDDDFPNSMLVNGLGPHQHSEATNTSRSMPYARFFVKRGYRYRFRFISAAILNCPIIVSVDSHTLTVIASDGNPISPVNATSLIIYPGERWDAVIAANQNSSRLFWMNFVGGVDCAESNAHQFAILEYEDTKLDSNENDKFMMQKHKYEDAILPGVEINSINSACYEEKKCVAELQSLYDIPNHATGVANYTFYLAFEMRRIHNDYFYSNKYYPVSDLSISDIIPSPQINNITFLIQGIPILQRLNNYDDVKFDICNAENTLDCQNSFCECLHMYTVPLGVTVDLVLIDEGQHGDENHPIHLHGQYFWVLGQDRPNDTEGASITREEVIRMDKIGLLKRNFEKPLYKDTVTIPDGGYTIVRFRTMNPGVWLLHCHLMFHAEAGMNLLFQTGESWQIPPQPSHFPNCLNYYSP